MENLEEKIDDLVKTIYTPDQELMDEMFIAILDELEIFLREMKDDTAVVNSINEILIGVQQAYVVKDYIYMADLFLYGIKEELECVKTGEPC